MARPDALPDPAVAWLGALALRAEADEVERAIVRRDDAARSAALLRYEDIAARLGAVDAVLRDLAGGAPREARLVAIEAQCRAEARACPLGGCRGPMGTRRGRLGCARRPYPAAYCRLRLAEATIADRAQRSTADAALREAHTTAVRLGAEPLPPRARGPRPSRSRRPGAPGAGARAGHDGRGTEGGAAGTELGLTPREAEILRLVAGGWSNQQIADRLFISRKTASASTSRTSSASSAWSGVRGGRRRPPGGPRPRRAATAGERPVA